MRIEILDKLIDIGFILSICLIIMPIIMAIFYYEIRFLLYMATGFFFLLAFLVQDMRLHPFGMS